MKFAEFQLLQVGPTILPHLAGTTCCKLFYSGKKKLRKDAETPYLGDADGKGTWSEAFAMVTAQVGHDFNPIRIVPRTGKRRSSTTHSSNRTTAVLDDIPTP